MKRQVKWGRPVENKYGDHVRTSKCGRFQIVTRKMSSSNGYWNERAYEVLRADGTRIGRLHDHFIDAQDAVEFENDPRWEPS